MPRITMQSHWNTNFLNSVPNHVCDQSLPIECYSVLQLKKKHPAFLLFKFVLTFPILSDLCGIMGCVMFLRRLMEREQHLCSWISSL